jgi:hypothetical protein
MQDQLYQLELMSARFGENLRERTRAGCRKRALRIRHRS